MESGQDAVLRALLYERGRENVEPYGVTVTEFTNRISELRNKLGRHGIKDEGIRVKPEFGAERSIRGNILAGNDQKSEILLKIFIHEKCSTDHSSVETPCRRQVLTFLR